MQSSILSAIANIERFHSSDLGGYSSKYLNRINAAGEQLEYYVKDSISNSFTKPQQEKESQYQEVFSYLGNQNNPPDMIIKGGDAFEVKKIEGWSNSLELNSSPPKDMLYSSDPRITNGCKNCEPSGWKNKDLFYTVGSVEKGKLRYLFFVHALCYAADKAVYHNLHDRVKKGISSLLKTESIEGSDTIELGKVKKVDPLGITTLRMRGMWYIDNPVSVFSGICGIDNKKEFSLAAILTKQKYLSMSQGDRKLLESNSKISVKDIKIKDPNNPAKSIDAKLINLWW